MERPNGKADLDYASQRRSCGRIRRDHSVSKHAAKATGPYRPQLSQFFLTEVADEQLHAQFLANKIVALGGEPTTVPAPVAPAPNNREMLEAVLAAERTATAGYTERARQAEE